MCLSCIMRFSCLLTPVCQRLSYGDAREDSKLILTHTHTHRTQTCHDTTHAHNHTHTHTHTHSPNVLILPSSCSSGMACLSLAPPVALCSSWRRWCLKTAVCRSSPSQPSTALATWALSK